MCRIKEEKWFISITYVPHHDSYIIYRVDNKIQVQYTLLSHKIKRERKTL
jgi:hypothetical protein